jgi:DNA helicase II / ATP-dependent DNA helicase PcrA
MIPDIPLTPELLVALGQELGGCDFADENQIAFLTSRISCDVQAAPGNGKTTLLVAKLALLSRAWTSRTEGVCVVSHTNAAREEVEKRLHRHSTAYSFLSYPHFVGTVTAFIDQYVALPYLRGLGWSVRRIDDEVFGVMAKAGMWGKVTLAASAQQRRRRHQVETWAANLELAQDFDATPRVRPLRLRVRHRNRQPQPPSASGIELEELKAELVHRGFYRFGDMTAIAIRALNASAHLSERIRARFPLVLLDEAQDTNGAQLDVLERLFGNVAVAYQRLSDQNQTLYEDDAEGGQYWQPAAIAIPLNVSRRFGQTIASFASRLTVRANQEIIGKPDFPSCRRLLLFDRPSIDRVVSTYGADVSAHWGAEQSVSLDVRMVASRHNMYRDRRGGWPKSLVDYCPQYRSGTGTGAGAEGLCGAMRRLSRDFATLREPREFMENLSAALTDFVEHHGVPHPTGGRFTAKNVWRTLAVDDHHRPARIRQLIVERILRGSSAWNEELWAAFRVDLENACGVIAAAVGAGAGAFCSFDGDGAFLNDGNGVDARSVVQHHGVSIRLGSVHSVKGRTADALLLVESEVHRSARSRAMDLATVLPHAFGLENRNFANNDAELASATNVFVAVTRPRSFLALAMRKEAASDELMAAAIDQGWSVQDLTAE